MSIFIWLELATRWWQGEATRPRRVTPPGKEPPHHTTPGKERPHVGHGSVLPLHPRPHKNPPFNYPPEVKALASDRAVVKEPRVKSCQEANDSNMAGGREAYRTRAGRSRCAVERAAREGGTNQSKGPSMGRLHCMISQNCHICQPSVLPWHAIKGKSSDIGIHN